MSINVSVNTSSTDDLRDLFDIFVDNVEELQSENISFRAKSTGASATAAGLPEITNLIIALGTAGVFTTLAGILSGYFKSRPKGTITLTVEKKGKSTTFSATNSSAEEISAALKNIAA